MGRGACADIILPSLPMSIYRGSVFIFMREKNTIGDIKSRALA